jgi:CBS domain containing-hemolysin-like protein
MLTGLLIIVLVFLLILSALLASSEIAFFSLSSYTVKSYKKSSDSRKRFVAELLDQPNELMVTILMMNIIVNILIQNVVSSFFDFWAFKIGVSIFLVLLFGEIIPKSIAFPNNTLVALHLAPYLYKLKEWVGPVRRFLTYITSHISFVLFFFLKKEKPISTEELQHAIETSKKKKILSLEESDLISGYLNLSESFVKAKMRTKDQIDYYDLHQPSNVLSSLFGQKRYSRVPVTSHGLDYIVGILSIEQYYAHKDEVKVSDDWIPFLLKPFYVPIMANALQVLAQMREKKESSALVVDEYGLIQGLISDEDLIESVIGSVQDEKSEQKLYRYSGKDTIVTDAKLELSEFEKIFHIPLKTKTQAVTVGGWLIEQLEDIPISGTRYVTHNFLFYVISASPHKINTIYIRKLTPQEKNV